MSLVVLYLGTRYDVCECYSLRHMTISSFLWPLTVTCDLHRPSRSLSFLSLDGRYCRVLVPSTKFVGSIEFEIWTIVWRQLKWRHLPFEFHEILNTNRPRVYQRDIPNFILIKHKRAEIQGREVNRWLWRKNGYYVTVNLTFVPRSLNSIGSEPVREVTI